ncbi:hypothetical protein ACIRP3_04285 [Streptomyces sp. NPDC101209]|uniref:hypothetical protein n=1 Tax=Streptomyces sp. NPDC101209 TaxID=3366129 RepID=UPI00380E5879
MTPLWERSRRGFPNDRGDDRVGHWYYDGAGLDYLGCDWHPSVHDHRIISGLLDERLAALPLRW